MLQIIDFEWMCAGMWVLYVDNSSSIVGHIYNVVVIFVQEHMPVMWDVHMPLDMVALFIALSPYEVDILT